MQVLSQAALPADGTILSINPSANFLKPEVFACRSGNAVSITLKKGNAGFDAVYTAGKAVESSEIDFLSRETPSYKPAKLGASIALVVELGGRNYAVLEHGSNTVPQLKLPSAFLNCFGTNQYGTYNLPADILGVLASRVMVLDMNGLQVQARTDDWFLRSRLKTTGFNPDRLRDLAGYEIPVSPQPSQVVIPNQTPHKFLPSLVPERTLKINYDEMPPAIQLNFDACHDSMQLIMHLHARVDSKSSICLAELEGPNASGMLERKFRKDGIVLMELDKDGFPTKGFYQLIAGRLVEWKMPEGCSFSEAFGKPDSFGCQIQPEVSPEEYFRSMTMPSLS